MRISLQTGNFWQVKIGTPKIVTKKNPMYVKQTFMQILWKPFKTQKLSAKKKYHVEVTVEKSSLRWLFPLNFSPAFL